jgi:hypothetical protein
VLGEYKPNAANVFGFKSAGSAEYAWTCLQGLDRVRSGLDPVLYSSWS